MLEHFLLIFIILIVWGFGGIMFAEVWLRINADRIMDDSVSDWECFVAWVIAGPFMWIIMYEEDDGDDTP